MTFKVACENGFTPSNVPKTGLYNYADIDDEFLITVHHWMKWYKFGFTRLWDNLSLEIRNGRLTREEAIVLLRNEANYVPHDEINLFSQYLGISVQQFFEIAESFRDNEVWTKRSDGTWFIKDFLISDWPW